MLKINFSLVLAIGLLFTLASCKKDFHASSSHIVQRTIKLGTDFPLEGGQIKIEPIDFEREFALFNVENGLTGETRLEHLSLTITSLRLLNPTMDGYKSFSWLKNVELVYQEEDGADGVPVGYFNPNATSSYKTNLRTAHYNFKPKVRGADKTINMVLNTTLKEALSEALEIEVSFRWSIHMIDRK